MVTTLLKTNQDTHAFLSSHPDPDTDLQWGCPQCHILNKFTYHSYAAHCTTPGCKGKFMPISLPIVGNPDETLQRTFMKKQIFDIEKEMEELKHENRRLQCEMDWNEDRVCALEGERKEIVERLKVK
jgi:hypothetical protein